MKNSEKIILDLCGGTGAWSKPYKDAGYDVRVITLPKYSVRHVMFRDETMRFYSPGNPELDFEIRYDQVYGVLAAPPCTMFSRARTTAKEKRDFKAAFDTVHRCLNIIWAIQTWSQFTLKFWALENPRGHLRRFLGRPPFKFHPYDFGDRYPKETFIWGHFNAPKKKPVQLTDEEIAKARKNVRKLPVIPAEYERDPGMKTIQIQRSITPQGFAEAFFRANK